ncbi:hypothetical protein L2D08_13440 [Domibacillus sp. PGB-M46]|nr:hypothetical protein [Domibacillus sp. PGB-M46]MCI2255371.1 hypothetical protein [Domibacillus sp. PGB-M46]
MYKGFEIAELSSEQTKKIQQLERELECTLIAYERQDELPHVTEQPVDLV